MSKVLRFSFGYASADLLALRVIRACLESDHRRSQRMWRRISFCLADLYLVLIGVLVDHEVVRLTCALAIGLSVYCIVSPRLGRLTPAPEPCFLKLLSERDYNMDS